MPGFHDWEFLHFKKIFGISNIQCLTGDREFIGHKWFSYLLEKLRNLRMIK